VGVFLHAKFCIGYAQWFHVWLFEIPGPHTKQCIALPGKSATAVVGLHDGHGHDYGYGHPLSGLHHEVEIGHAFLGGEDETAIVIVVIFGLVETKLSGLDYHALFRGVDDLSLCETIWIECAHRIGDAHDDQQNSVQSDGQFGIGL